MAGKIALSLSIDATVNQMLEKRKWNESSKSDIVNSILKHSLLTEEGLIEQIERRKKELELLENELEEFRKKRESFFNNIPEKLKNKLNEVKAILERRPDRLDLLGLWTNLINDSYHMNISETELKQLIERWA